MNISCGYPWFGMDMRNQATTLAVEQTKMRQVPQKGSTIEALTHRKWTDKSMGYSDIEGNLALSLSRTQPRRLMRSKVQPTSY